MLFNDGVSLEKIDEDDQDVSLSEAGEGLFEELNEINYSVETSELFHTTFENNYSIVEDEKLFENEVEYKYIDNSDSNSQIIDSTSILIMACLIVVITYIYIIYQKRSIKKNLNTSRELVRTLE